MVDVIVETDTTYMDRVRSRVASLPGYPLEELLPRIERTKDVEPLAALFDPDRRVDFRESLLETGLDIDDELAEKLPLWSDRFMALRIDTDGSAAASDVLDIADEFARYKRSKSAVQFPYTEPVPADLITRMSRYQAERNVAHD